MKTEKLGKILKVLIETGSISITEYQNLYNSITDDNIYNDLNDLCNNMGLFLSNHSGVFYVSPIPLVKTFTYTNEEMKKELGYSFNNEDLYVSLFIIANIVTAFCPEANSNSDKQFLKVSDLMDIINKKAEAMSKTFNLDEISFKTSYNFEIVVKKWLELQTIKMDKNDSDTKKEYGKSSKIQIINTTLKFLREQKLISLSDGLSEQSIYITDRFKATIFNAYNSSEIQRRIYDYIDSIK